MKKFVNFRPLVFLAVFTAFGILSAYLIIQESFVLFGAIIFLTLAFIVIFIIRKKSKGIVFLIAVLFCFSLPSLNFFISVKNFKEADLNHHYLSVAGRVIEVKETEDGERLVLENLRFSGAYTFKSPYKMNLYAYGSVNVEIGNEVSFSSYVSDYTLNFDGKFSAQNLSDKIKYFASVSVEDMVITDGRVNVFESVNLFIKNALKSGLSKQSFSVAHAMILGESGDMDVEVLTSFRQSGIAHIFAVSGLHIGFLGGVIAFILKKLKIKGFANSVITVLLLLFYAGVCGFTSSAIRATIMTAVILTALNFGEKYDSLSSVAFAFILILFIFPSQLFCVGFLLSFSAVLGIILLAKPISRLFKFLPKKLSNSLGTVLSAQIFTLPVMLFFFGEASLIGVIMNLLFIPIVSVVFVLTFVTAILCGLFYAPFFLFLSDKILWVLIKIITFFDYSFFIVSFSLPYLSIIYYSIFLVLSGRINFGVKPKTVISLILSACLILGTVLVNVGDFNAVKCVAMGSEDFCGVLIEEKGETTLVVSKARVNFFTGPIKRAIKSLNAKGIDNVILNGNHYEVNSVMSRLYSIDGIERAFVYSNDDLSYLSDSFIYTDFEFDSGERYAIKDSEYKFMFLGEGVSLTFGDKSMIIMSPLDGKTSLIQSSPTFDTAIAYDFYDLVFTKTKAKNKYCFTEYYGYKNAQSQGNLVFTL